jgi:HPt (histidine-containing phosphotransfer) domain-containing protein
MTATTNPAARSAGALFDPSTFLESIDQDLAVFGELAALFLTTSVEQTAVLAAALDAGDLAAARDTAHGLKGSFALFATRPAIDVVARLEADCRTGATFDRRQRGAEVTAIVDAVRAALVDYCNAHAIDLSAAPSEQPAP